MITLLSLVILVVSIVLGKRVAIFGWDAAKDMLTKPLSGDYMATWGFALALSLSILGFLIYVIYQLCLTIAANLF